MCSITYLKYRLLTRDCYSDEVDVDAINDHCGGAATLSLLDFTRDLRTINIPFLLAVILE